MGWGSKFAAIALCAELGMVLVPGCVIHIGPGTGTGSETQPDPTTGIGGADPTGGGGADDFTPEEQAAFKELQNVDPAEILLKGAAAQYAAGVTSSLVESQVQDPNIVDPAILQQLFNQYAPAANDAAQVWMSSVAASTLPESIKAIPKYECMFEPYTCKHPQYCPMGDSAVCVVTGCGKGTCPWCSLFGQVFYESYCTYACMQGSKYWGYGFTLRERFKHTDTEFICFPFSK